MCTKPGGFSYIHLYRDELEGSKLLLDYQKGPWCTSIWKSLNNSFILLWLNMRWTGISDVKTKPRMETQCCGTLGLERVLSLVRQLSQITVVWGSSKNRQAFLHNSGGWEHPAKCPGGIQSLVRAHFPVYRGVFSLFPHMVERGQEDSRGLYCVRALIPFVGAPPAWPDHLRNHWAFGFNIYVHLRGVQSQILSIAILQ